MDVINTTTIESDRRQAHPYGRRSDDTLPRQEVLDILMQIHAQQQAMDNKLSAHMRDETKEIAHEIGKYMASAFPEGDPDGHRKAHEAAIERAKASAAFWKDLRNSVAKWGVIGFLGWVVLTLWHQFLQGPAK